MAGATLKPQNQAPRATPTPFNADRGHNSLGDPNISAPQNHQPIAESFTSEQENPSPMTAAHIDAVSSNEFYIPQSADTPAAALPTQPAAVETVKRGEYHPGYVQQMLEYFDRPKVKEVIDTYTWKSGAVSEKKRYMPNTPPHFTEFARSMGVSAATLKRWAAAHEEFGEAYQICQEIFEEFLIDNGLTGAYGAIAMKFVAVNRSKMKDKQTNENVNLDINDVLDQIAAGKLKPGGLLPGQEAG